MAARRDTNPAHARPRVDRRRLCIALAAFAAAAAWPARAAGIDYGAAIDTAGRQRMLSQRIVKAYCQLGLGVTPEVSRAQLTAATRRFDAQLDTLALGGFGREARTRIALLAARWKPMRQTALGRVDRAGALRLAAQSEAVLEAAQALVMTLQAAAGTAEARLVNVSGRQRMLSQRLAKLYLLRAWAVDVPGLGADLEAAAAEFSDALAVLRAAPENTAEIGRELEAVALQWDWFSSALALQGAASHVHIVADASEAILNSMELITARYAALARR